MRQPKKKHFLRYPKNRTAVRAVRLCACAQTQQAADGLQRALIGTGQHGCRLQGAGGMPPDPNRTDSSFKP